MSQLVLFDCHPGLIVRSGAIVDESSTSALLLLHNRKKPEPEPELEPLNLTRINNVEMSPSSSSTLSSPENRKVFPIAISRGSKRPDPNTGIQISDFIGRVVLEKLSDDDVKAYKGKCFVCFFYK